MFHAIGLSKTRSGAIRAGTIFALIIAIVVGLVGAVIFKTFVLGKATPLAAKEKPPDMVEITVAALNLTKCPIQRSHYKKVLITKEAYDDLVKGINEINLRNKKANVVMLIGDQPLSRVPTPDGSPIADGPPMGIKISNEMARKYSVEWANRWAGSPDAILAEQPIFSTQLLSPEYPEYLSERVRPGMRAVDIDVPANRALFQVDDYVDISGAAGWELPNGEVFTSTACFGPGKIISRYGTIYPACCPQNRAAPTRRFTVEVSPCQFAAIQLAQGLGVQFLMAVGHRDKAGSGEEPKEQGDGDIKPSAYELTKDEKKKGCCTFTVNDLQRLFQVPVQAVAVPPNRIELYNGTNVKGFYPYGGTPAPKSTPQPKIVPQAKQGDGPLDRLPGSNPENPPAE
jgi:hypothetical protein